MNLCTFFALIFRKDLFWSFFLVGAGYAIGIAHWLIHAILEEKRDSNSSRK